MFQTVNLVKWVRNKNCHFVSVFFFAENNTAGASHISRKKSTTVVCVFSHIDAHVMLTCDKFAFGGFQGKKTKRKTCKRVVKILKFSILHIELKSEF